MRLREMMTSPVFRFALLAALAGCAALQSTAQQTDSAGRRVLTAEDYKHAEKFMAYNVRPLVFHDMRGKWLPEDRYLYRDTGPDGSEFVVFDATHGTRQPAFDHAKIAAVLSAAAGASYNAAHLPFMTFEFAADGKSISFQVKGQHWTCDLQGSKCRSNAGPSPK